MTPRVAVLGAGNMAGAMVGTLRRAGFDVTVAVWRVYSGLPALAILLVVTWMAAWWTARAVLLTLSAPTRDMGD